MIAGWRRTPRFGHPEVFALIGALSFAVARFVPVLAVPYACPFKAVTHLPCATCGMTHAFVALAHGDLAAAFAASPLGALLAAAAWLFAAADGVRALARLPWPELKPKVVRLGLWAGVAALFLNWAWMIARSV